MNITLKTTPNHPELQNIQGILQSLCLKAEQEVANKILKLPEDVSILLDTNPSMVDPTIGVGGYTDSKNQITLSLDPVRLETIKDSEIFATLVHELSHVKQAYGPWYGTTLFDYIVFEGLGVAFEEQICGKETYYPAYLRENIDAPTLVKSIKHMFDYDDSQYNYMDFVVGSEELGIPPNAVYGIGLYIVDRYLARTGKKASELLLEDSTVFRET